MTGNLTTDERMTKRTRAFSAAVPLVVDVAIPVGLFYLLSAVGLSNSWALVLGGVVPFLRSAFTLTRGEKPDYLALMMVLLFVLGVILAVSTQSPRFILAKESFGSGLIGLWCLATVRSVRPMTYYTARPILTKGQPDALESWDRLSDTSREFRSVQQHLAVLWGCGLLIEAAVRLWIVATYSVHVAAGAVNIAAVGIIALLCVLSGPAGGIRLQRLVLAETNKSDPTSR